MAKINTDYGAQALDINQLLNFQDGTGIITGCTPSVGTNAMEVDVASGTARVNGTNYSITASTVLLDSANADHPRKDLVVVDNTGSVTKITGTAGEAKPAGSTRRNTRRPRPSDISGSDVAVIAEVWVGAGASDIVSGDISDRRLIPLVEGFLDVDGDDVAELQNAHVDYQGGDARNIGALDASELSSAAFIDHELGRYQQQDALEAQAGTQAVPGAGSTGATQTLTDVNRLAITAEADASGAASSGDGSRSNPYLIEAQRWDNSEGSTSTAGFYWDDPDADYHIKLKDFEIYNYENAQLHVNAGPHASLLAKNGLIYTGTGSGHDVQLQGGTLRLHGVELAGSAAYPIDALGGHLSLTDVDYSASQGSFGSVKGFAFGVNANGVQSVGMRRVTSTDTSINRFIQINHGPVAFDLHNLLVANTSEPAIVHPNNSDDHLVKHFRLDTFEIRDTGGEAVELYWADDVHISGGNIFDTADGSRGIALEDCHDCIVERCRFSDANGTGGAGNELVKASRCREVIQRDLWADNASEDAFETIQCRNAVYKNVGGVNITGQIVDIYGTDDEGETIVEDVCGQADHTAVLMTDADHVTVQGRIATRTKDPAIILENRNASAGVSPDNCFIACDLPPAEDSNTSGSYSSGTAANGRIGINGDIGNNNLVTIYANDGIQRKVNVKNL